MIALTLHRSAATGTTVAIPLTHTVGSALQTKPPGNAIETGCHVADDATHNKRSQILTIGTRHHDDALAHEAFTFIDLGTVAACGADVVQFPSHWDELHGAVDSRSMMVPRKMVSHVGELGFSICSFSSRHAVRAISSTGCSTAVMVG